MTPDEYARVLQIKLWKKYSVKVRLWIMIANYFMAILPGILYVISNIYFENNNKKHASFNNKSFYIMLGFQALMLVLMTYQMIFNQRFMSHKLIKVQMLGNLTTIAMMLLSTNEGFLSFLKFSRRKVWNQVFIFGILLLFAYSILFVYTISPLSDLHVKI